MDDPFIGTIIPVGFNFAPVGWGECNGQLLPIAQNQALFSLLGTAYGGDGISTFALPDLRGRVSVGLGQGGGLSPYTIGQRGGAETITLIAAQLPGHQHGVNCTDTNANVGTPVNGLPATDTVPQIDLWSSASPDAQMSSVMIGPSGSGAPHENRQPYQTVNWIIALEGLYPPRS